MGRGIAHVAALGGFRVALNDVSMDMLRHSLQIIEKDFRKQLEVGRLTVNSFDEVWGNIHRSVTRSLQEHREDPPD